MYKKITKRFIDILISIFSLPFLLILILIVGVLIYLEDKESIFYIAPRLGKDGKIFNMYKFRSMKVNSPDFRNKDGSTYNSTNDSRLTKVGDFLRRTSIDELPQILNVLIGDMSFIGPRPDLPGAINDYTEEDKLKLKVRPGITGYNQAYFRNSIPQKQKFENDVFYVQNISLKFDIEIILQTIRSVFTQENIYKDPQ